jgi:hypothetical protein
MSKKFAGARTRVEPVEVRAQPGLWLEGAPHVVVYVDSRGRYETRSMRLAGNTLVWTEHGLTLRLEGRIGKARALALARTIR